MNLAVFNCAHTRTHIYTHVRTYALTQTNAPMTHDDENREFSSNLSLVFHHVNDYRHARIARVKQTIKRSAFLVSYLAGLGGD